MRKTSTFCLALLILAACHRGPDQTQTGGTPAPSPQSRNEGDEGPPMMDRELVHNIPVHLTPTENDGLKKAIDGTPVNQGTQVSHIHADVQDGHLVFVPEQAQDPAHVTKDAPRITIGSRNPRTVAVVATPAAQQLLNQRASPSQ